MQTARYHLTITCKKQAAPQQVSCHCLPARTTEAHYLGGGIFARISFSSLLDFQPPSLEEGLKPLS